MAVNIIHRHGCDVLYYGPITGFREPFSQIFTVLFVCSVLFIEPTGFDYQNMMIMMIIISGVGVRLKVGDKY